MNFSLKGEMAQKSEKWPENPFAGYLSAILPISGPFFPYFHGEAKIRYSAFFPYVRPENPLFGLFSLCKTGGPNRFSPRRACLQLYQ